jgi:hypothetical protein
LRDATTLRKLVEGAGFGLIEMRVLEVMRRMPASAASVVEGMTRAPYARDVAAVEEAVRQVVGEEVSAALQTYRDGNEVVIPHRSHRRYPEYSWQRREWGLGHGRRGGCARTMSIVAKATG